MEIEIKSVAQFDAEKESGKVLVDFYATWCNPCRMLAPIVAQVAEENPDLKVLKVDVDQVGDLASRYQISSIPTLLLFKDGKLVNSALGYMPKVKLAEFIA